MSPYKLPTPNSQANAPNDEIERYLRTGEYDPRFSAWAGDIFARERLADSQLKEALINEIRGRTATRTSPSTPVGFDLTEFTCRKVEPMVRGLFCRKEQDIVLDLLVNSVLILTGENIFERLRECTWLGTAWNLANIHLDSIGATPLAADGAELVGLSEGTTCYISSQYFHCDDRFSDFLIHEAAHVFHNCKRVTAGLPQIRRKDWLLEIDFRKREVFAYVCEAYSRILEIGATPAARRGLLRELSRAPMPSDDRVSADEYMDILEEAVRARNGWKRIRVRCAPAATDERG